MALLVRGDLSGAWELHPLALLAAPFFLFMWVRAIRKPEVPLSPSVSNRLWIVAGILLISVWLIRLATGHIPPV